MKQKIRFSGRLIRRGYSPKYYDIPLLLEALKHKELAYVKIEELVSEKGYDHPQIILYADSNLLRQTEAHYEDLLRKKNNHLSYDELKALMPQERKNADLAN